MPSHEAALPTFEPGELVQFGHIAHSPATFLHYTAEPEGQPQWCVIKLPKGHTPRRGTCPVADLSKWISPEERRAALDAKVAAITDWTYEVAITVQVQISGQQRDKTSAAAKRLAFETVEAHGALVADAEIVGWWPTNEEDGGL